MSHSINRPALRGRARATLRPDSPIPVEPHHAPSSARSVAVACLRAERRLRGHAGLPPGAQAPDAPHPGTIALRDAWNGSTQPCARGISRERHLPLCRHARRAGGTRPRGLCVPVVEIESVPVDAAGRRSRRPTPSGPKAPRTPGHRFLDHTRLMRDGRPPAQRPFRPPTGLRGPWRRFAGSRLHPATRPQPPPPAATRRDRASSSSSPAPSRAPRAPDRPSSARSSAPARPATTRRSGRAASRTAAHARRRLPTGAPSSGRFRPIPGS